MRRSIGVVLLLAGTATGAEAQELAVLSRADDIVTFHALPGGEEIARASVGPNSHEIALGLDGVAYVPSYGGNDVYAIDLAERSSRQLHDGEHRALHGAAASRRSDLLWITAEESQMILELQGATGEILRTWPTGGDQSHMVVATSDDRKLYVANMSSGSVTAVDRERGSTVVIPTGGGAEGLAVSPDDREVWVSNRADATISVIDTESDEVLATFPSQGNFPVKVRFRPGASEVWVVNNQGASVTVFDADTRALIETIDVGERPLGLTFDDDGVRAYVTRPGVPEVAVVDASTKAVIHRFPTGASADGMAWIR